MTKKPFKILLIKPSKYDDDGYVIRWFRGVIPSNSLAVMNAIAMDAAERRVLGPDVDIDISIIDEVTARVDIAAIKRRFRRIGNYGLVGLVGVQSNQFPRAIDIARPLREAGIKVIIGGFHVSGLTKAHRLVHVLESRDEVGAVLEGNGVVRIPTTWHLNAAQKTGLSRIDHVPDGE